MRVKPANTPSCTEAIAHKVAAPEPTEMVGELQKSAAADLGRWVALICVYISGGFCFGSFNSWSI